MFDPSALKKRLILCLSLITTMLPLFSIAGCAGATAEQRAQHRPLAQRSRAKETADNADNYVWEGIHTRSYPDGKKAEKVEFKNGLKNGSYISWYKNGHKRLQCQFISNLLDGEVTAWFENGTKRFSVNYHHGKRQGGWIRYHEKGGILVSMHFDQDRLDGLVSSAFNHGYGNGSGMSYKINAIFKNGRIVGAFSLQHTDYDGHTIIAIGKISKTGVLKFDRKKNIELKANGKLVAIYGGATIEYHSLKDFFIQEINHQLLTKFSLDFCNHSENIWQCQFPRDTI